MLKGLILVLVLAAPARLSLSVKAANGDAAGMTEFLQGHLGAFKACFARANPRVKGDLRIQFDVNYRGASENLVVPPDTFPNQPQLGLCVIGLVKKWMYPVAPLTKVEVTLHYE